MYNIFEFCLDQLVTKVLRRLKELLEITVFYLNGVWYIISNSKINTPCSMDIKMLYNLHFLIFL